MSRKKYNTVINNKVAHKKIKVIVTSIFDGDIDFLRGWEKYLTKKGSFR